MIFKDKNPVSLVNKTFVPSSTPLLPQRRFSDQVTKGRAGVLLFAPSPFLFTEGSLDGVGLLTVTVEDSSLKMGSPGTPPFAEATPASGKQTAGRWWQVPNKLSW